MIKSIDFPNRTFANKQELFIALKKHKNLIIDCKKAVKFSTSTKANTSLLEKTGDTSKEIHVKENHSLHVINTTKVLDSHNDLHLDGLWSKSVKEQRDKTYFLVNHTMGVGSVIAYPKDVSMRTITVSFKDLGFDFEGNTQALVFEIDQKNVRHEEAKHIIENKIAIEHSIRMSYIKIDLAINSDDKEFKAEKEAWDKFYPLVANKDVADERGHMWLIKEAAIEGEGSMVLGGSNHVTPMINSKGDHDIDDEEEEIKEKGSKNYPYSF